jgi:8-oxo-dGTP diphosphatase
MKKGIDFIGVGVGAVIVDKGRILLLLRRKSPEEGSWSIPGGSVEFGETIEDAVIREIKEELGIDCTIITLLRVTNHISPLNSFHWVSPAFLVRVSAGTPKNIEMESHEDMQWFPIEDLPINLTITTRLALESYREYERRNA